MHGRKRSVKWQMENLSMDLKFRRQNHLFGIISFNYLVMRGERMVSEEISNCLYYFYLIIICDIYLLF